jgi:hypothetical protein
MPAGEWLCAGECATAEACAAGGGWLAAGESFFLLRPHMALRSTSRLRVRPPLPSPSPSWLCDDEILCGFPPELSPSPTSRFSLNHEQIAEMAKTNISRKRDPYKRDHSHLSLQGLVILAMSEASPGAESGGEYTRAPHFPQRAAAVCALAPG